MNRWVLKLTKNEIKTYLIDAGFEYLERNKEFLYDKYFFASFEVNNSIMLCSEHAGQFTRWFLIKDIDKNKLENECGKFFNRIKDHKEKCMLIDLQRDFK